MEMVASNFDYLFHFIQLSDKRQKRLKAIYEMSLGASRQIDIRAICEYDIRSGSWRFYDRIGPVQREYASESDPEAFEEMRRELARLAESPVGGALNKGAPEIGARSSDHKEERWERQ